MYINHSDRADGAENRMQLWKNLNILCETQYIKLSPQDDMAHVVEKGRQAGHAPFKK